MIRFVLVATVCVAAANLAVAIALTIRRVAVRRSARRVDAAEAALRPLVLALVDGERVRLPRLDGPSTVAMSRLLRRFSRLLSGSARRHIAESVRGTPLVASASAGLGSRRAWRRAAAAVVIGDIGDQSHVRPLLRLVDDPALEVRSAVVRSLGRLGAVAAVPAIVRGMAAGRIPRSFAGEALMAMGSDAAPELAPLSTAGPEPARAAAVDLLGLVGAAAHTRVLAACLADASPEVRVRAARALGRMGARRAVDELRKTLADPVPFVRAAAARALAVAGDQASVDLLVTMALTDQHDPAAAAAEGLALLDPDRLLLEADRAGARHLAAAADRLVLL